MTPEQWQQVEEAFHRALDTPEDTPEGNRAALLEELDAEVRGQVERLLAASSGERDVERRVQGAATLVTSPEARLGPWLLVRPIGEGGMGTVYLAVRDDGTFEKRVAVKFVRRATSSPILRERFDSERRILAKLEHPNIARLLDAGSTEDGTPYLVMEYIDGPNLVDFARSNALSAPARVQLFLRIARAVEHLHACGVIHRDLKPNNVLIDSSGEPRLVDFGLAKLIDSLDAAAPETTAVRIFTPAYASPEQFRGVSASTATDIYGLGALLFELLAEEPAFKFGCMTPDQAERTVLAGVGSGPSARVRASGIRVDADLDRVVLKAMRPDPSERYASAAEFADDLLRYLEGRPVKARAYTPFERAAKFVRRRPWAVAAATCVLLAAGIAGALAVRSASRAEEAKQAKKDEAKAIAQAEVLAKEASQERQAATEERGAAEARRTAELESISQRVKDLWDIHGLPGNQKIREESLQKLGKELEALLAAVPNDFRARYLLGESHRELAYLYAHEMRGAKIAEGVALYKRSRAELTTVLKERADDWETAKSLALSLMELANTLTDSAKDQTESQAYYKEARRVLADFVRRNPKGLEETEMLGNAASMEIMDRVHVDPGKLTKEEVESARKDVETAVELAPNAVGRLGMLSNFLASESDWLYSRGDYKGALAANLKATAATEREFPTNNLNRDTLHSLITRYSKVMDQYRLAEGPDSPNIEVYAQKMVDIGERLAVDMEDRRGRFDLAMGVVRLATAKARKGRAEAMPHMERGVEILRGLVQPGDSLEWHQQFANYAGLLGNWYFGADRVDDAIRSWESGMHEAEVAVAMRSTPDAPTAFSLNMVAQAAIGIARAKVKDHPQEAVPYAERAVQAVEKAAPLTPDPQFLGRVAVICGRASLIYAAAGQTAEAKRLAARSLDVAKPLGERFFNDWPQSDRDQVRAVLN